MTSGKASLWLQCSNILNIVKFIQTSLKWIINSKAG